MKAIALIKLNYDKILKEMLIDTTMTAFRSGAYLERHISDSTYYFVPNYVARDNVIIPWVLLEEETLLKTFRCPQMSQTDWFWISRL